MREDGLRNRCSQPLFFVGSPHSMLKSPPSRAGSVFGLFSGSRWKLFRVCFWGLFGRRLGPILYVFCIFNGKVRKAAMKMGGGPLVFFLAFGPPSVHVL